MKSKEEGANQNNSNNGDKSKQENLLSVPNSNPKKHKPRDSFVVMRRRNRKPFRFYQKSSIYLI